MKIDGLHENKLLIVGFIKCLPEVQAVLAFTHKSTGDFKQVHTPTYPLLVEGRNGKFNNAGA